MPVRLSLVSSPINVKERYGAFSGAASRSPSFGLVCLAAAAQSVGALVSIVEASSNNLSIDETLREILKFEPDVVGITSTTAGIFAAGGLAKQIKEADPDTINCIGGCHVTALPEETLQKSLFNCFKYSELSSTSQNIKKSALPMVSSPSMVENRKVGFIINWQQGI